MTKSIANPAVVIACTALFSWSANAATCTKDQAMEMYSTINTHATSLKLDAEQNPSKIPLRSGKNDPRLKKSIKISKKASAINKDSLSQGKYDAACTDMEKLASKYNIQVGDKKKLTAQDGLKAATQARSVKQSLDNNKNKDKKKLKVPGF